MSQAGGKRVASATEDFVIGLSDPIAVSVESSMESCQYSCTKSYGTNYVLPASGGRPFAVVVSPIY